MNWVNSNRYRQNQLHPFNTNTITPLHIHDSTHTHTHTYKQPALQHDTFSPHTLPENAPSQSCTQSVGYSTSAQFGDIFLYNSIGKRITHQHIKSIKLHKHNTIQHQYTNNIVNGCTTSQSQLHSSASNHNHQQIKQYNNIKLTQPLILHIRSINHNNA